MTEENLQRTKPGPVSEGLDFVGDMLLFAVIALVAWQFVWGVVAPGLWQLAQPLVAVIFNWPKWARMIIGLPILIVVLVLPVGTLGYYLLGDPGGAWKLVELRRAGRFQGILEALRKSIYCLAVFSVLRTVWGDFGLLGFDPTKWLELLRKIASVFLG